MTAVLLLGVDENGLGPRLGPLVVTGVSAHAKDDRARVFGLGKPPKNLRATIDDSKALVAFGNDALAEAWARVIARRTLGRAPTSVKETLDAILLDDGPVLEAPCPTGHSAQCWGRNDPTFEADDALVATVDAAVDKLAAKGIALARARSVVACTRVLNDAAKRGVSRFRVDLGAMERIVLATHAHDTLDGAPAHGESGRGELTAICGKVGGYDFYREAFDALAGRLPVALREGRKDSSYLVRGVGTVSFVQDADARCLLVAIASLVGKWVRDVLMGRIVTYWRTHDESLPSASGYHDPVTNRFVAATRLVRTKIGFDDACFERNRAVPARKLAAKLDAISSVPPKKKKATERPKTKAQTALLLPVPGEGEAP